MHSRRPLATALVGALALVACGRGGPEPLGTTAKVEQGRIERRVVATGTIEPEKEVEVRPRISGIVERIHVKAGDRVRAGQPLLEIEKELSEGRLDEARAQLEEARADLRYAESAMGRAVRLHRDGTMDDQEHDEISSRFARARASVARAEANVHLLEIEIWLAVAAAAAGIGEGSTMASAPVLMPRAFVSIVITMIVVGVAAGILPALRASRIDPAISLRAT